MNDAEPPDAVAGSGELDPGLRYCVRCGGPLTAQRPPGEERVRAVCARCGYVHYVNPRVVCGTLPVWAGRVWLLRRAIEPRRGYWSHPAGYLEVGETVEAGAVRETAEEIGWTVRLTRLLGVYSQATAPVVNLIYLAEPQDPASPPVAGSEVLEVAAFAPAALPWDRLAFSSTMQALRDWLAGASPLTL